MKKDRYDFYDLLEIMKILRSDNGCPWDKEQDHISLKRYFVEETYEVLEAIDLNDPDKIKEELGDVLLQVIFHSEIAYENSEFNIFDVIDGICKKLVSRHTHVFGEEKANTPEEVLKNWNEIKKKEKNIESRTEIIKEIPKNLPSLLRSLKIQEKAAKAGFDWEDKQGAIEKTLEEVEEFIHECNSLDKHKTEEEFGDILFSLVNVSRFLDINPELALEKTINKFIRRFEYVERQCMENNLIMENMTLTELDKLWDKAKEEKL